VAAGAATGTGAAQQASTSIKATATHASGTGTAYDATASSATQASASAGHASGTGTAYNASVNVQPWAIPSAGTGVAYLVAASVAATVGHASGSGAAYNATVSYATGYFGRAPRIVQVTAHGSHAVEVQERGSEVAYVTTAPVIVEVG
jgi:hypothetical protein